MKISEVIQLTGLTKKAINYYEEHELLRYLEKQGFEEAPNFIGSDDKGREILSFIPADKKSRNNKYLQRWGIY